VQSMMVTRYSPRWVCVCAKADELDMSKLPAARAVQMIDLMRLCPRLNPAKMAEAKLE
jgi:hypothetical protein